MKVYAIFNVDSDNTSISHKDLNNEEAVHKYITVPTLAWADKDSGFVEYDMDKEKISHFVLFPDSKSAIAEAKELSGHSGLEYIVKELELDLTGGLNVPNTIFSSYDDHPY
jgi:hypothetical protein